MVTSSIAEETTPTPSKATRFGRYTLIRKIAHGGMATLYLARLDGPRGFEKFFALKKIHPHLAEEREFVEMFLDEARFASLIQHPNVVQIFELGEERGDYFFAMEYLEGESLAAVGRELDRREVPPPRPLLAHIVARTATGLHAAHELRGADGEPLGLVHRDVSPHNVLVTFDGVVKLVDFGIAKAAGRLSQTTTGELKGKYAFMSPEALLGSRAVDRRSDIFSLGVVLYEITTLRRLFKDESEPATLDNVARCHVPLPTSFDPAYPRELEAIVLRALQRKPADRYQTAAELAADLDAYVEASGERVTSTSLGHWMSELFAEQASDKRRILNLARRAPPTASSSIAPVTRRVPPWLAYGILSAIGALVVTLTSLLATSSPADVPVGTLRVMSTPLGGTVSLDEAQPLGVTPLEIAGLALGVHRVRVTAEGHEPQVAAFTIQQSGQLVTVVLPLERVTSEPTPREPTVTKADASVADAGGAAVGEIDRPAPPDKRATSRDDLGTGYLNLNSTPWAEVYYGGRKLGTTPLVKARLPAGRKRLKLLLRGSPPAQYLWVNIEAGTTHRATWPR
jgi:serine/threonine-protein kinase